MSLRDAAMVGRSAAARLIVASWKTRPLSSFRSETLSRDQFSKEELADLVAMSLHGPSAIVPGFCVLSTSCYRCAMDNGRRHSARAALLRALGLVAVVLVACAGSADDDSDCAGPGVYQRGKEGGPSCCADLNVYYRLAASGRGPDELTCEAPVGHAEFGCVEGRCGDDICEAGERGPCGCTLDCPAE